MTTELTEDEWREATTYDLLDWHCVFDTEDERDASWAAFLAHVRRDAAREALRNVEVQLVGELSAGTYLADWATLTARDVRGGIWHVYDRIPEETP